MASAAPQNNASDLERQPLINNDTSRSHLPSGLGRHPNAQDDQRRHQAVQKCWKVGILAIGLAALVYLFARILAPSDIIGSPFSHLKGSCDHVAPIGPAEFQERQNSLSHLLVQHKASAYIAEPGANMRYFSSINWSQSERPFLLIVQAALDKHNKVVTKITIVAPAFEASRAKQYVLPGADVTIRTWEEGGSAFRVVRQVLDIPVTDEENDDDVNGKKKPKPKDPETVYIDPDMRQFVSFGIANEIESSSRSVEIADHSIALLRMRKSSQEVEILKCVSQTSVKVIRAVKEFIDVGIRESEVQALLTEAYAESGLEYSPGGSLVLFGQDAALPHGSGNDTVLENGMMVLIDTGAVLHGYLSDITRTFWVKRGKNKEMNEELDKVWEIVKNAQIAGLKAIHVDASCSSIDKAARTSISDEGYGSKFTHRLGHGLGLEGHEEPYLNIGNTETKLRTGMVFTNEPGVYVEGQFGIRLEDVVLVTEEGYEILSGALAESPYEP
ncbi:hypothetical protein BGZ76_005148 [Entomortierella beljakovae]|nr:hypothetical protein BGZ76_005148 [Entomortierella beljakovae]